MASGPSHYDEHSLVMFPKRLRLMNGNSGTQTTVFQKAISRQKENNRPHQYWIRHRYMPLG